MAQAPITDPKFDPVSLKQFGERARKVGAFLAEHASVGNLTKPESDFLHELQAVVMDWAESHTWSASVAKQKLATSKFTDAAITFAFQTDVIKNNGGGGASCTSNCTTEKTNCVSGCDGHDAGYTCYFDCRLSYYACLAGCIVGSHGGGTNRPA